MAGYNPLNYFSFGKKKDAPTTPKESADQVLPQDGASEVAPHADTVDHADIQDDSQSSEQPLLRVIKGNPTVEEIAALTVLVASYQSSQAQQEHNSILTAASRLLNRRQRLGASLRPGPGSWRRARPM